MRAILKVNSQPLATDPTEFKVILFENWTPVTTAKKVVYVPNQDLHRVYWSNSGLGGTERRQAGEGVIFSANVAFRFLLDCPVVFGPGDTLSLDLLGFDPVKGFARTNGSKSEQDIARKIRQLADINW